MGNLEHYAVVSCHVERLLDDRIWAALELLLARRPSGFVVTPLLRPPHAASGEGEERWLERAHRAAELGPLGHHTHWGGPTQARPVDGIDAAAFVHAEADWLRAQGLSPRFFCGGGWYLDRSVAETLASFDYVDLTATTFRQAYLAAGAPRLQLAEPCRLRLPDGSTLLELPATHSVGMLARGLIRLRGPVHVHFHDWELIDRRRAAALDVLLRVLRRRREPASVAEFAEQAAAAPEVHWDGATIAP